MSELIETLRPEFQDREYRHAYAEECLNAMIASQIKVLREQREMTQKQLGSATGMGQPRIPLIEDASYENWTVNTLKRLAKAFDVALSVKFETFSQFVTDFESMSRESLQRSSFPNDKQFQRTRTRHFHRRKRRRRLQRYKGNAVKFAVPKNQLAGTRKPSRSLQAYESAPNADFGRQCMAIGGRQ
jgi:transcriptional regulator with XRE-family HTH domain